MQPNPKHTDINLKGLIGSLKEPWRSYALLLRLDRPIGVWLLFFPALYSLLLANSIPNKIRFLYALVFLIGSWSMRSAGCIINDIWDRNLDAQVERTQNRPLANSSLSLSQAYLALFVLLILSACLLLFLPLICFELAPIALILAIIYPAAKRYTPCPQLVMGCAFGFSAPFAYAAVTHTIDLQAIYIYASVVLWQTAYDTIYGFQDMKDDMKVGVNSLSILVRHFPRTFLTTVYSLSLGCFLIAALHAGIKSDHFWLFLPGACSLAYQVVMVDIDNNELCLYLFKSNAVTGLLMSLGLAARLIV